MVRRGRGRRNSLFAQVRRPVRGAKPKSRRFLNPWSLIYLVAMVLVLAGQVRSPGRGDSLFSRTLLTLTTPPMALAGWTSDLLSGLAGEWTRIRLLYRSQNALEDEVQSLRAENALLRAQAGENQRLRTMLGLKESHPSLESASTARVQGLVLTPFAKTATIGMGSRSGLAAPSPVVVPEGVAGRLLTTSPLTSRVLLITDPRFGMGVRLQRTRIPALLATMGDGQVEIRGLEAGTDLQIGDQVISSGLDGIFPADLPVGEISALEPLDGGGTRVLMKPYCNPHLLEEVLVLPPVPAAGESTDT